MGGYISSFLCNIVGFVYPMYSSFKAIETPGKDDDTQWLIYWVIYSIFSMAESVTDIFVFWFPFYYEMKLVVLILLQIPQLKLPLTLYQSYVRPFLKANETKIDTLIDETNQELQKRTAQATKMAPAAIQAIRSKAAQD